MTCEQMTVFEFLPKPNDLDALPEADMVKLIGDALGVEFTYDSFFEEYAAKLSKKLKLTLEYDNYFVDEWDEDGKGARFVSCGWDQGTSGGGAPRDSVTGAIEYFRGVMRKYVKDDK